MFRYRGEARCQKVRGMLSEYIDKRLSHEEQSVVESHIEKCEACSSELESLQVTVQLLHRVPVVPTPRSFAIKEGETRRLSIFGPQSLRWLRPATAIVAIALVVLIMGDLLHAFENNAGVNSGGNATYTQLGASSAGTEQQMMVAVPGVMGQMSLATAKAVGYTDYTLVPPSPVSQPATQPIQSVPGNEGLAQARVIAQSEVGVGWPLRQIEIGLVTVVFALVTMLVLARRQRRRARGTS